MSDVITTDLVVIGGGPAGMTAALYAVRAKLDTVVLESNVTGGLVNSTYTVENFPSWPSIHGMELMEKMRAQIDELGVTVEEVCEVESLELDGQWKKVVTDSAEYRCKAVILATGRVPLELDTPTQAQEVHHCAICDGAAYAGRHVLVVGGGNSAFDESLYLLASGIEHITLVEAMPRYFAAESTQEQLFSSGRVDGFVSTKVVDLIVKDGVLTGALLENSESGRRWTVDVAGVFVFLGQKPNNSLFKDILPLTKQGYIKASELMETGIPGVFSAGDINDKAFRQITTAVADGTIAALSAERYIRSAF